MKHYETGRMYPFRNAKRGFHSSAVLHMAYDFWANAIPGRREDEWATYCDIRDGLAIGTNKAIRDKHKQQSGLPNEHRYVGATVAGKSQ